MQIYKDLFLYETVFTQSFQMTQRIQQLKLLEINILVVKISYF